VAGTVAIVSFRLGGSDGVSVEAAKWAHAFEQLGLAVVTVAGSGHAHHLLPGLSMGAPSPPTASELSAVLAGTDLVVVENLCSLPLNTGAALVVADVLRDRPAVLHHHDLPWQRPQFIGHPPPPDDPHWVHVTVNDLSRRQLQEHGITATVMRNAFDTDADADTGHSRRQATRHALGLSPKDRLVLQPTRAIPRKNVGGGMMLAEALGAVYWLLGRAEDGYGPDLDRLVADARGRGLEVLLGYGPGGEGSVVADAYRACDVVTLPSTWEGFGNPALESAVFRRPLAIGPYPVAAELAAFGFRWFALDEPQGLARWLEHPDDGLLEHNAAIARRSFSVRDLPARLAEVLAQAGLKI
jgi:mannosylglucosylglycerate synthase